MFVALAENYGNLRDKVDLFVAFAPIAYMGHSTNWFMRKVISSYSEVERIMFYEDLYEINGTSLNNVEGYVCKVLPCTLASKYNREDLTELINMRPANSASWKQIIHYAQNIATGKFRQFKYLSKAENLARYGTSEPPEIDLT